MATLAEMQARLVQLQKERVTAEARAVAAQVDATKVAEAARVAQAQAAAAANEAAAIRQHLHAM